ncbi:MAG TPA: NUDIX hydrolase, partial [Actinotalea sp.]|nr:NUDIX hydrolase [Actinotalea sp.]
MSEELADLPAPRPVVHTEVVARGLVFDLLRDRVDLGDVTVSRDYLRHPGAVAVIALDPQDRVLLVRQYRHAVRTELWEPPAGLLDVPGEPPHRTAARELAEEADLVAGSWWRLASFYSTPGFTDER